MDRIHTLQNKIEKAVQILITAHVSPDGDAIGSTLALWHYLNNKGKNATIVVPNRFPKFLQWMQGQEEIVIYEQNKAQGEALAKMLT